MVFHVTQIIGYLYTFYFMSVVRRLRTTRGSAPIDKIFNLDNICNEYAQVHAFCLNWKQSFAT